MFSVESHWNQLVLIEGVNERIGIDVHGCSVEDNLVDLSKLLEKEVDTWADENIDLYRSSFNNYPHLKIAFSSRPAGLNMRKRELAMNKRFIKIQYKSLPSSMLRSLWSNDCILLWYRLFSKATSSLKFHQLLGTKFQLFLKKHLSRLRCYLTLRLWWCLDFIPRLIYRCWRILANTAHRLLAWTHAITFTSWVVSTKSLISSLCVGSLLLVHLVCFIYEWILSKFVFN